MGKQPPSNVVDEWGYTRLHYTARKGAYAVVERLLEDEYECVVRHASGALALTTDFRGGMSSKHRMPPKLLIPFATLDDIKVEYQRMAIRLYAETCGQAESHVKIQNTKSGEPPGLSSEGPGSQALGLRVVRLWVAGGGSCGLTEQSHA